MSFVSLVHRDAQAAARPHDFPAHRPEPVSVCGHRSDCRARRAPAGAKCPPLAGCKFVASGNFAAEIRTRRALCPLLMHSVSSALARNTRNLDRHAAGAQCAVARASVYSTPLRTEDSRQRPARCCIFAAHVANQQPPQPAPAEISPAAWRVCSAARAGIAPSSSPLFVPRTHTIAASAARNSSCVPLSCGLGLGFILAPQNKIARFQRSPCRNLAISLNKNQQKSTEKTRVYSIFNGGLSKLRNRAVVFYVGERKIIKSSVIFRNDPWRGNPRANQPDANRSATGLNAKLSMTFCENGAPETPCA